MAEADGGTDNSAERSTLSLEDLKRIRRDPGKSLTEGFLLEGKIRDLIASPHYQPTNPAALISAEFYLKYFSEPRFVIDELEKAAQTYDHETKRKIHHLIDIFYLTEKMKPGESYDNLERIMHLVDPAEFSKLSIIYDLVKSLDLDVLQGLSSYDRERQRDIVNLVNDAKYRNIKKMIDKFGGEPDLLLRVMTTLERKNWQHLLWAAKITSQGKFSKEDTEYLMQLSAEDIRALMQFTKSNHFEFTQQIYSHLSSDLQESEKEIKELAQLAKDPNLDSYKTIFHLVKGDPEKVRRLLNFAENMDKTYTPKKISEDNLEELEAVQQPLKTAEDLDEMLEELGLLAEGKANGAKKKS